jgi:hypothetical protein
MPRGVSVVVEPGLVEIAPGGTGQIRVRVVNHTGVVDQFIVALLGVDPRMTPPPQRIGLFPEQEGTVGFDLAVPTEQAPTAGQSIIAIRVTSQDNPRLSRVEELTLSIGATAAGGLRVQPPRIKGGRSGRFSVVVSNDGNIPMRLALRGEDESEEVAFTFEPPLLDVPPGTTVEAGGRVRAFRPFSGPETQRSLTIHGEGGPVPLNARATFVQRSAVGSRVLRAVAVVAVLAVALGIFLATRHSKLESNAVAGQEETSATPSPTPSATSTVGNGEGPVPDVSGQGADAAAGALATGGFVTDKELEHSNTVKDGEVIRTDPTPGKATGTDHKVTLIVSDGPTPPVDLINSAKDAIWSNGTVGLPFNGPDGDPRGFVLIRENVALEDGSTPQRVLETHPQQVGNGFVQGDYTLPQKIIAGDHFVADVGFLDGQQGEVDFTVFVVDGQGVKQAGTVHDKGSDGALQHVDFDLSQFAGATTLRIRVDAGDNSDQDSAVWVAPRVTGTPNAPGE